jgi:uncharacterized MAPEG superfamily protein
MMQGTFILSRNEIIMTVLVLCLFVMVLLPYLAKIPMAMSMNQLGGYDNNYPREQAAKLHGFGARAYAAHQNSFEALSVFSAVILAAIATNHTGFLIQFLAVFYVLTRFSYHALYLMNLATLRSMVWGIGYLTCLFILGCCIF